MSQKIYRLMSLLLLLAFVLSACAPAATTQAPAATSASGATSAPDATSAPMATSAPADGGSDNPMLDVLPEIDPADYSGTVVTAGSSTVYPLSEAMAKRFEEEGYAGKITIDSIGSGAGLERFCKTGETDIANSSRPIKASEIENCALIGRTPIEFRVGTDALAVVVSQENDFITELTLEQVAKIFSKDAVKWNDVDPSWPAEDIQRFSPGTDSGTFDYFVEAVLTPVYGDEGEADKKAILEAANIQFSEDDNVLVQGVEGSKYAIGYFGFAYYVENTDKLKAIAVNGVEPNEQSAEDGSYPLSRPLFIYSDAKIMTDKPEVAAFINFYLTYVDEEVIEVGYFPASDATLMVAADNWKTAQNFMDYLDPAAFSGDVVTAGSSTVYPLSEAMAKRFEEEGFGGKVTIDSIGSGAGLERFCKTGETDVANSSRPIKQSEIDSCAAIGRTPIEFRVGTDALAVVVSQENDFITELTLEQVAKIFSKDAVKWSDIDPSWPAEDIQRFSPGTDSGTFDYFVEAVLTPVYGDEGEADKKAILEAANIQFSEDDNVLVQGVEGSKYAIGYFGFAYYIENTDKLKALPVNGVEPNEQTAEDGSYPLSRPLFIYSDAKILQDKPQVAAFIKFYLTYVNEEVIEAGYFPASREALLVALQALDEALR